MAHFARIENGIVQEVIVISNNDAPDPAPLNSESLGKEFIRNILNLPGDWIQTSFNGTFRGNYAGIGYIWDPLNEVFIPPRPYPSWTLNENWNWIPPIPLPVDGQAYQWNEELQQWDEIIL